MLIYILLVWIGLSVAVGVVAAGRGRKAVGWTILACLISPVVAGIFLMVIDNRSPRAGQPVVAAHIDCPGCGKRILRDARICRHCGGTVAAMAEHSEAQRIAALRQLGVSAPLVQLSSGHCVHEAFRGTCLGPPNRAYPRAGAADGPAWLALWDQDGMVYAALEDEDGLEFNRYSIERPRDIDVIARTEQGFWLHRFDFLYERDMPDDTLRQAAKAVGFRYLDRYLHERRAAEAQLGTFAKHRAWLQNLIAMIDGDAGPGG
ncbi:hypothetical protein [Achromobacter sp. UMC46]|uniref:hypothetical protein n=1 Tax=Achromobacter sp. UMC46 TaxID=1862319 RepID=UPI001600E395|nr:hypothetical protein [Achromobacter sp. UMC46]MBB1594383.1 hypothetical protein [Achromobacter sp. UMC46]